MAKQRVAEVGIKDAIVALKRERTIAAAVELFYELGYENTTLEAVADRLGVTKPFIYAHFGSKAELLAEICSRGIRSSLQSIDEVRALPESPTAKLKLLVENFLIAVVESQKHLAIFAREEKNLRPEDFVRISEMRRDFDRKLLTLLKAGVEKGEFNLPDPAIAALAIGGMVSWAYVWYRANGRLSVPELQVTMAHLVLSMAGAKERS